MQFGNFNRIKLEPMPSLRKLVKLAVDAEEGTQYSRLSKTEIVDVRISDSTELENLTKSVCKPRES